MIFFLSPKVFVKISSTRKFDYNENKSNIAPRTQALQKQSFKLNLKKIEKPGGNFRPYKPHTHIQSNTQSLIKTQNIQLIIAHSIIQLV